MSDLVLSCRDERRRDDVRAQPAYGLDAVEVSHDQRTLTVTFLGKAPPHVEKENVRIRGGRRITDIGIHAVRVHRHVDTSLDETMEIRVDQPGDFSTYTLDLVAVDDAGAPTGAPMDGFDPRYRSVEFTFKAGCPTPLDCRPDAPCPPPVRARPEINYLAKDYASFRQLMFDRLALLLPDWRETHVPDLGVALVELLAYVADHLSYYQDAVATEAYLDTARQRISVRRHARLVDYAMHDGCNARAWLTLETDSDGTLDARGVYFLTAFPGAAASPVLRQQDVDRAPVGSYAAFEAVVDDGAPWIDVRREHGTISFYTWGDCECCLPTGATSATLRDRWISEVPPADPPPACPPASGATERSVAVPADRPRALRLKVGDVLIFEEVVGPKTGMAEDADPTHRQAVRLTRVTPAVDSLYDQPVVEIEWASEDALAFPLCLSARMPPPDCTCRDDISVAHGNVILVDGGCTVHEPLDGVPRASSVPCCPTDCAPPDVVTVAGPFAPRLRGRPLTFASPLPSCGSARARSAQDPRDAMPAIVLSAIPPAPDGTGPLFDLVDLDDGRSVAQRVRTPADAAAATLRAALSSTTRAALDAWDGSPSGRAWDDLSAALARDLRALLVTWVPRRDLLESAPDDRHFVVEMDDDGVAHLRFGNGDLGRAPEAGTVFRADLRTGNGPAGNVGADTIAHVVRRDDDHSTVVALTPRNPLPATGGTPPEPVPQVKLLAPSAFRTRLERAITADDYGTLASDDARRLAERSLAGAGPGDPACAAPFRRLQGAKATLRWTGSWYEALVAVDPLGTDDADPELLDEVRDYLEPYRRVGHDLVVAAARYVGLDVALTVCVQPHHLRGHVEAALRDVLGNRVLPDGTLGLFHPDRLTFGGAVHASRIVAAAQRVPGVESVRLTRLDRSEVG